MKLHALILLAALGTAMGCALVGQYVPAAVLFVGYVLWTVVRDATGHRPGRARIRGWYRR